MESASLEQFDYEEKVFSLSYEISGEEVLFDFYRAFASNSRLPESFYRMKDEAAGKCYTLRMDHNVSRFKFLPDTVPYDLKEVEEEISDLIFENDTFIR